MLLNNSCAVSGTGFLISSEIIDKNNGWKYHLLTEDIEFTIDSIINGEKIGYCNSACFYDEQPTSFRDSWNQRMRWSKGFYQVFFKYGYNLFKSIFKNRDFSCYDMFMTISPMMLISIVMILFNSTVTKIQIISYQKNEMKKYSKNKIKMSKREDIHFYKYKKNTTQMVVF